MDIRLGKYRVIAFRPLWWAITVLGGAYVLAGIYLAVILAFGVPQLF